MSGEFGEYSVNGYIDEQVRSVARSCANEGHQQITRLWGKVFESLIQVAEDVAYSEEHDSSEADCILSSMNHVKTVQTALDEVKSYLTTFNEVLKEAIYRKEHGK